MSDTQPSVDSVAAVAAADRMTEAVKGLGARFDDLRVDTKIETRFLRKVLKALAGTVVVDICLSLAAFGFGWEIHNVAVQARAATAQTRLTHTAAVETCSSGNDFKIKDKDRWDQLLALSPAPTTSAAIATRQTILLIIDSADALRDCTAIK